MFLTRPLFDSPPSRDSRRRGWHVAVVLASVLLLGSSVLPAEAAPSSAVSAVAPDNLRCPGTPAPPPPGPDWKVVPIWEWRNVIQLDGTIGSGEGPYAVAVDRSCNIYLTDSQHFQLIKLSKDGTVVARWPLPGDHPAGESNSPQGVAVDTHGNVYATDTPKDRVYKFSPDGKVIATWGVCDTPTAANKFCDTKQPGRFIAPQGIAVDGGDNVYVAEGAGARIQKFSADGEPKAVWDLKGRISGDLFIPGSLSLDQGGNLYMTDAFNNQVVKFDTGSGNVVGHWGGTRGNGPGQFANPLGIGVDGDGNFYVSDQDNWRVQKLGADGGFQAQWRNCLDGDPPCQFPDAGQDPGQFMAARGIAVDGQGTVYVADTNNKRLQRLMIVDFELIPPPPSADGNAG
jgi:tripartite motif-containing protein 71